MTVIPVLAQGDDTMTVIPVLVGGHTLSIQLPDSTEQYPEPTTLEPGTKVVILTLSVSGPPSLTSSLPFSWYAYDIKSDEELHNTPAILRRLKSLSFNYVYGLGAGVAIVERAVKAFELGWTLVEGEKLPVVICQLPNTGELLTLRSKWAFRWRQEPSPELHVTLSRAALLAFYQNLARRGSIAWTMPLIPAEWQQDLLLAGVELPAWKKTPGTRKFMRALKANMITPVREKWKQQKDSLAALKRHSKTFRKEVLRP